MSVATVPAATSLALPRGLGFAMLSAAAFGSSGTFAKSLTDAGWSPGGAVTARIGIAALILLIPGWLSMRGRWAELMRNRRTLLMVVLYGMISVAGCQLAYFLAIQHVSVGVALLLEYLGPVMLMGAMWAVTRSRPSSITLIGAVVAVAGLFVILDVVRGAEVNLAGIGWGLLAAASVATYFYISGHGADEVPPLGLAWLGLSVGAVTLGLGGAVGIVPMAASTANVTLAGTSLPFWVSVLGVAFFSTVVSYSSGVVATRRLGSTVASFVGLSEVLFAVLFAWLLIGERLGMVQLIGAIIVLTGVVLVQHGSREPAAPVPS